MTKRQESTRKLNKCRPNGNKTFQLPNAYPANKDSQMSIHCISNIKRATKRGKAGAYGYKTHHCSLLMRKRTTQKMRPTDGINRAAWIFPPSSKNISQGEPCAVLAHHTFPSLSLLITHARWGQLRCSKMRNRCTSRARNNKNVVQCCVSPRSPYFVLFFFVSCKFLLLL